MKQKKKVLSDSDTVGLNTIEYAKRYAHNKKRCEDLKPKKQTEDEYNGPDDSSGEDDVIKFDPKIRNNDPVLKNKEVKLFDDVASDDVAKEVKKKDKKKKKEKDANANLLLENGADDDDDDVAKDQSLEGGRKECLDGLRGEEESKSFKVHPRKIEGSARQRQRESKKEREEIKRLKDVKMNEKLKEDGLPKGFYYVEAIRKSRTRRGKKEYLIKWSGFEESVNTWEPIENLESVRDIVNEFEDSLKAENKTSNMKKKGRNNMQTPVFEWEPVVEVEVGPDNQAEIPTKVTLREYTQGSDYNTVNEKRTCTLFPKGECRMGATCPFWHGKSVESSKIVEKEVHQTYSRRKKGAGAGAGLESMRGEHVGPQRVVEIISIIQPPPFTRSNGVEETFSILVKRSNGQEDIVSNKYLKEHNPDMLINYYEKYILDKICSS